MATTADKKKKKAKAKAVPLQDFLAASGGVGTVQVTRKVSSWADEIEEDEHDKRQIIALPTAPRASRIFNDDSVPHSPPFLAYISNLPYDVLEDDIREFFMGFHIVSLRLPREEGEMGRLRGFGYIEFETRGELIDAVSMPDPAIRNRRVRIDVSNESDQQKQRGGQQRNSRYGDRDRERDDRDQTNWRRGNEHLQGDRDSDSRRGGYGGFKERERDSSATDSNWRLGERPNLDTEAPKRGFGDGTKERYGDRRSNYEERKREPESTEMRERPKLNLKPRTLPIEPIILLSEPETIRFEDKSQTSEEFEVQPVSKFEPVPATKIFGDAKPVDTAAREREIEERMERDRLEKQKLIEQEKHHEKQNKENEQPDHDEVVDRAEVKEVKKEEIVSWRKRPDANDDNIETRQRPPSPRRYSPDERRVPSKKIDDRRGYRDNRDSYQKDREYKDGRNQGRSRDNRQDIKPRDRCDYETRSGTRDRNDRDSGANRSGEERFPRRDKLHEDSRDIEDRMPKFKPVEAPNLSMSNKYAAFLNDDDADE